MFETEYLKFDVSKAPLIEKLVQKNTAPKPQKKYEDETLVKQKCDQLRFELADTLKELNRNQREYEILLKRCHGFEKKISKVNDERVSVKKSETFDTVICHRKWRHNFPLRDGIYQYLHGNSVSISDVLPAPTAMEMHIAILLDATGDNIAVNEIYDKLTNIPFEFDLYLFGAKSSKTEIDYLKKLDRMSKGVIRGIFDGCGNDLMDIFSDYELEDYDVLFLLKDIRGLELYLSDEDRFRRVIGFLQNRTSVGMITDEKELNCCIKTDWLDDHNIFPCSIEGMTEKISMKNRELIYIDEFFFYVRYDSEMERVLKEFTGPQHYKELKGEYSDENILKAVLFHVLCKEFEKRTKEVEEIYFFGANAGLIKDHYEKENCGIKIIIPPFSSADLRYSLLADRHEIENLMKSRYRGSLRLLLHRLGLDVSGIYDLVYVNLPEDAGIVEELLGEYFGLITDKAGRFSKELSHKIHSVGGRQLSVFSWDRDSSIQFALEGLTDSDVNVYCLSDLIGEFKDTDNSEYNPSLKSTLFKAVKEELNEEEKRQILSLMSDFESDGSNYNDLVFKTVELLYKVRGGVKR